MAGLNRKVLVLALARSVDSMANSFVIVVLPVYIASDQVTGSTLGLAVPLVTGILLSAFGIVDSLAQPFTGYLSDKYESRKLFILIGLGMLTIVNFTYIFSGSYLSLLGIRLAEGIAAALAIPATIALVNELANEDSRGGNMGMFNTFRLVGFGAGPMFAGIVIDSGPYVLAGTQINGFDMAFLLSTLAAAIGFFLVEFFVHDPERLTEKAGTSLTVPVRSTKPGKYLHPIFVLGLVTFVTMMGVSIFSAIENHVNLRLGQSDINFLFGAEFAAFIFAQIIFQIPVGKAADRYGRRPFLVGGLMAIAPITLLQGFATIPLEMFVLRFLQGVAGAAVLAPALTIAGDVAEPGNQGSMFAVVTMSFGLGTAMGPLISGYLIRFGFVVPFAFSAVSVALISVLAYTQIPETLKPASTGS
ncbi:MAG: MFS transporter [Halobacteria archaeon]